MSSFILFCSNFYTIFLFLTDTSSIRTAPIVHSNSSAPSEHSDHNHSHLGFVRASASCTALHTAQADSAARQASVAAALRAQSASEQDRAHADAMFSAPTGKVESSASKSGGVHSGGSAGAWDGAGQQPEAAVPRVTDWRARVKLQRSAPPM
jgi:hypothetical protein